MLKKKNVMTFILFLIILSITSAVITYKAIIGKSNKKPAPQSASEEATKDLTLEKIKGYEEIKFSVNDAFNDMENLSIKNNPDSSIIVEVEGKNKGIVLGNFKALEKKTIDQDQFTKEVLDFDSYDYELGTNNKNIIIRVYDEACYMTAKTIEDGEDKRYIYKLNEKELEHFMKILKDIYLDELLKKILYPLPDEIYINANDENAVYIAQKREIKNLVSNFKIISIEEKENYIGVPTIYPSYDITIKREDYEQKFYLKNNELMIIDTPMVYLYCKYDKALWDYIGDKLHQENKAKENELKYLLKSERVVVKDLEGIYDLENHTYYNIELPRQIIRSELKKIGDASQTIIDEDLKFVLRFYVYGQSKEVLIYNNYIIYEGYIYYSKNIDENVRSTLMII